jgi:Na+/melibiose symporter-like transporter
MQWLKEKQFYIVALIYMCTRALINVIMVYMSFYLIKALQMESSSITVIPLVMYLASFFATFLFGEKFNDRLGRKGAYVFGCALTVVGSFIIYFTGSDLLPSNNFVYASTVIFGVGTSIVMVTGVSFVNDLVGDNVDSSAFVYGCMSFTDKLGSGLLIILIQGKRNELCNDDEDDDTIECGDFVTEVLSILPAGCCIFAAFALPYVTNHNQKKRKKIVKEVVDVKQ